MIHHFDVLPSKILISVDHRRIWVYFGSTNIRKKNPLQAYNVEYLYFDTCGIMKVHAAKLEGKMILKGNSKGFLQGFLEGHLHQLADNEIGETFINVLALTLYGVMLFLSIDNFIDFLANVFIACKVNAESPITIVLDDVNGNLNLCYDSKRKKLCILLVLYVWFISHVSQNY